MRNFKPHPLAFAIAASFPATATYAQDDAALIQEEVLVTGYRRSVQNSLNIKRDESSIVEAISAEDIGKLPDSSIAESLARLPGLAGERRGGRTSGISVRGFNENFVGTTMNGREILGVGDNRGVEYDLYPSEIISSAVVYKTPEASLITQGVGGSVDLRTMRPLENDRIMAVNATFEQNGLDSQNSDFDDTGKRLSFTFSDKFADDTVGLSVVVATLESPSQEEQFRAWGYNDDNAIVGQDSFVRSAVMERDTFSGVLQYEPSENLSITLDALYIDFEERDIKRGLEEQFNITNAITQGGRVVSGEIGTMNNGFNSVIRNDGQTKTGELKTFGLNANYQLNDTWSMAFDASRGESSKELFDIESYSGTGRPQTQWVLDDDGNFTFATDEDGNPTTEALMTTTNGGGGPGNARSFEMTSSGIVFGDVAGTPNYADPSLIKLAGPQAWGGSLAPISAFAPTYENGLNADGFQIPSLNDQLNGPSTAQDGFINNSKFDEELTNVRFTLSGELELGIISGVQVGLSYSDREKTKTNLGAFLTSPEWPADGLVPEKFRVGTINLSHIGGVKILGYDSIGLYNSGYYTETAAANLETSRLGDTYKIEEQLTNIFVQLELATQIGNTAVTGNVGVQVANADQKASGFSTSTGANLLVNAIPVSGGTDYTKILPSLNLNFEITEDFYVRTALSKTLSRPRMDDIRPNNVVSFAFNDFNIQNSDIENGPWSGSSGNPELKPFEANQFDLSTEWYFADEGVLAATFFYKDLTNWTVEGREIGDFSPFYIPGFHDDSAGVAPVLTTGIVTSRADGLEGFVRGLEYTATVPFSLFHDALNGLGLVASATFTDGEFEDDSRIPGLSEEIYQLTGFYQKGGFEFRLSGRKRDAFASEARGGSLSLTPSLDAGAEIWDAQIGYDFADSGIERLEGLTVTLQAQNLTDEDTVLRDANGNISQYQAFGSNYLLGLNYKF